MPAQSVELGADDAPRFLHIDVPPPEPPPMPPLPPEREADEPDFFVPDEVLRAEVEALFAADRARLAPPDFDPLELFDDFLAPDFAAPRAGERAAVFFDELFEAELFAAVLLFVPLFDAVFFAPDFAALFLAPELFALDFLAPLVLEPDLRDLVALSAILASFRRSRDAVTLADQTFALHTCSAATCAARTQ